MLGKKILFSSLFVLLISGFATIAVAGDGPYRNALENDIFRFDAPKTPSEVASIEAAKNHVYDQEQLERVGTEGGHWEFRFGEDTSTHGTMAGDASKMDPVCTNC